MNRQLLISQGEMLTSFDGRLIDNNKPRRDVIIK